MTITLPQFKSKLIAMLEANKEHNKRLKMWKEGHTDNEIAIARNTDESEIRKWRKDNSLPENMIFTVMSRKPLSLLNKGKYTKGRCGGVRQL